MLAFIVSRLLQSLGVKPRREPPGLALVSGSLMTSMARARLASLRMKP